MLTYQCYENQLEKLYKKNSQIVRNISKKITNFLIRNNMTSNELISTLTNKHQQFIFGIFLYDGLGVTQNSEESFRLMKLSADQGHIFAEFEVGESYKSGNRVSQNEELSFQYYLKSAEKGFSIAQHLVGSRYEEGKFVKKDLKEAIYWYEIINTRLSFCTK